MPCQRREQAAALVIGVRRGVHGPHRVQIGAAPPEHPAHEEADGHDTTVARHDPGERRPERVALVLPGEQLSVPRVVTPAEGHTEQREDLFSVIGRRQTHVRLVALPTRRGRRSGRARRHTGELLVAGGERCHRPVDVEARRGRRAPLSTARTAGSCRRRRPRVRRQGQPDREVARAWRWPARTVRRCRRRPSPRSVSRGWLPPSRRPEVPPRPTPARRHRRRP